MGIQRNMEEKERAENPMREALLLNQIPRTINIEGEVVIAIAIAIEEGKGHHVIGNIDERRVDRDQVHGTVMGTEIQGELDHVTKTDDDPVREAGGDDLAL